MTTATKTTTTTSRANKKTPHPASDLDVSAMSLMERVGRVQTEAVPADGTTKAFKGTYAPATATWDESLKPLFAKYHLSLVSRLVEGKGVGISGNPEVVPVLIVAVVKWEDDDDAWKNTPLVARFHLESGVPQDVGKQLTYYRRYALLVLMNLSVNKDPDDLDAPRENTAPPSTPKPPVNSFTAQVEKQQERQVTEFA